jgi:predicted DCC family thiol-disulfide oxidoreductase YuxK
MVETSTSVVLYFDGACHLCSREIEHYRKIAPPGVLSFFDISEKDFDAASHGLDPSKVQEVMHVRDASGNLRLGVDAFIAIWEVLPRYQFLARLARKGFVRPFLDVGYFSFAKIRPYLPRKKLQDCESGTCRRQ